ncbi:methyl-accepting chemotaxis protein [Sphingomicrobium nitratireducens]|uniref:methyl-accepting chemotaxis protein n=1 Tax=Sphingomicrobium nitratireducens TaxID=2964666 RepID=UPI0023EF42F2|nr:methyl-accepting chemotaxis protein [Sphingomicrobium nitratireducens]
MARSGISLLFDGPLGRIVGAGRHASETHEELLDFRIRGMMAVVWYCWACSATFFAIGLFMPTYMPNAAIALSAATSAIAHLAAVRKRYNFYSSTTIALMATLQPAILLYMMQDQGWQTEAHFFFFLGLAATTMMCDWRPVVLGAAGIALHHLLVGHAIPYWLYPDGIALSRTPIHIAAIAVVAALLSKMAAMFSEALNEQGEARSVSFGAAEQADEARREMREALEAQRRAEEKMADERVRREQAEKAAREARARAVNDLAASFEGSISEIITAVGAAAAQLKNSAGAMADFSRTTGQQASDAMHQAKMAADSADQVTKGVVSLTRSISSVADTSREQRSLSETARGSTDRGGQSLKVLSERTANIQQFVELIRGVANQTNLLALNATIEAARAGDAGRGFAVVAGEVKGLAAQAGTATEEIATLIGSIGEGAAGAEGAFSDVAQAMARLLDHAATLEFEVEKQRDTSLLIEQTAEESALSVDSMSRHCTGVAEAADKAARLSDEVSEAAARLSENAERLQHATADFLDRLYAA